MTALETITRVHASLASVLDERSLRLWAAAQAQALGHGGIGLVASATGLSRSMISDGLRELGGPASSLTPSRRIRRPGGGRKRLEQSDQTLLHDLEQLVDPLTRGDPMSPLRWTCKSTKKLAAQLCRQGHRLTARTVARLLRQLGYRLQSTRKTQEGASHPDRNAQFEYINAQSQAFLQRGQPVISVDAKKKELVGNYQNAGQEWQPQGTPQEVNVYDFPDKEVGKAIPYGVYDLQANQGWVSVGCDHDTAPFAVQTMRRWWQTMGQTTYPNATEILVNADGGGSNGSRCRLWKVALQEWADETGLTISVCHFPPGTSKWNKIEHRMFCHITQNWRGKPLSSHEVIVNLIANTTTEKGLRIQAALDTNLYPTGTKVSEEEMQLLRLEKADFHGEWNYKILPRNIQK
jgi:transposase